MRRITPWRIGLTALALVAIVTAGPVTSAQAQNAPEIKLVLQITVDGLRGDLIERYRAGFGEKGFNRLLKEGAVFTNVHYQHANTETIVGHATLATGAHPAQHGLIGNVWFDDETKELAYNIEDAKAPLLPTREEANEGEQVDPAQKLSRTKGRSPMALLAPTLGDTLSAYYAGKSKVFGVSGKDRSAVAMAGKVGKAFWYSTDNGDFVTSKYYYDDYPSWASDWNQERKAESYAGANWALSGKPASYLLYEQDDRAYEVDLKGYGRTFPHQFGEAGNPLLYTQLLVSPVGDELLLDFAKELMRHEELGQDAVPDYFSISFSGVDAINHFFGPSSLENEEVMRRLDATLAELLTFVDKQVGLEHALIVLSADHGMADMAEYMSELGYEAGRLTPAEVTTVANKAGENFGIDEVTRLFYRPYLYLDEEKITEAGQKKRRVEKAIAKAISDINGVEAAIATHRLEKGASGPLIDMVRNNHHPSRSGDIYVAQQPYWFLFDEGPVAAMHGSPWRYDTHVPLIFVAPDLKAQTIARPAHPTDVAPTLAAYLGITAPASAQGTVLQEVAK
ncbi:MAG: alkaline phosphatase family protein [Desulfuromonadales bacterium]|nr:alkaline phosphatase family protein [Desulfuromonadales bacterium]